MLIACALLTGSSFSSVQHSCQTNVPLLLARAGGSITHIYPQPYGPRLVLADDQMTVALFSPLTDELTPLPGFEGSLELVSLRVLVGQPVQCTAVGPALGLAPSSVFCRVHHASLSH